MQHVALVALAVCVGAAVEFRFTNACPVNVLVQMDEGRVICRLGPNGSTSSMCRATATAAQGSFRVVGDVLSLAYAQDMPRDAWWQVRFEFHAGPGTPTTVAPVAFQHGPLTCQPLSSTDSTRRPTRHCPLSYGRVHVRSCSRFSQPSSPRSSRQPDKPRQSHSS
ncbi:hypothetical protein H310_05270 [Aphanomyces invadans]|uniref:Reelin domain-containing protein n=1 Tax=Aphanomyces invadans TaxID=157072 RepID=A0A024U923_9STRA|nr:hypothetical protein H310_05270 [Aphanomyces invadans]ETW02779.1 hypothetical protein H310_05270 [Aphanomyces invadans]|eukprot:XP_008868163.1 hypothetical protein H310_05270 [Aphanomyces invadans]